MKENLTTYLPGEEIRWRKYSRSRSWNVGFVVARRNSWIVVRLADGAEIEVHPSNVKEARR